MSGTEINAQSPTLPSGTSTAAILAATSVAINLTSFVGKFVRFHGTEAWRANAAKVATAASTADFIHLADTDYHFRVTTDTQHLAIFGDGTAGTLYYYKAQP